jgi:endo-1,4-beta-xylanase
MHRRDFLHALAGLGLTQSLPALRAEPAATSLQALAASKGLCFGSCLALKYCTQAPQYQQLFLEQCGMATPEVHMKWDSLSNQAGVYDFSQADNFVGFCAAHHLLMRGHTLIWHQALPGWVTQQMNPANGQQMMKAHIQKVAGHFAGKLYSWDVVNEVLDPGSQRTDGLRDSPWLRNCGAGYLAEAFHIAAVADPRALLIWNETYLEVSNGFGQAKRSAMLAQLDGLLAKGVPIHGVGLESHLRAEQAGVLGDTAYEAFLAQLAQRGMKIFITELDVQDSSLPADPATRDQAVAAVYQKFLTATLRQPAVHSVVTWGLADRFTWIAGYRPRKDGMPVRPLPFDADYQPKPAYYAIARCLQSAPARG